MHLMTIDHNGIFLCKFGNIMWNVFTAIKVCNTHLNTMKVRDKLLNNRFEYPNIMTIRKEGLLLPSFLEKYKLH